MNMAAAAKISDDETTDDNDDNDDGAEPLHNLNSGLKRVTKERQPWLLRFVENPDYSWMRRLLCLQKAHILKVNQTQYEVRVHKLESLQYCSKSSTSDHHTLHTLYHMQLACLSTMGGAYSICKYPKEALQIAQKQEQVGIRSGSKQIQCHAKLYQFINLVFLGKRKAGLKMLEDAQKQADELESDSLRKHCDITENWLNNQLEYSKSRHKTKGPPQIEAPSKKKKSTCT